MFALGTEIDETDEAIATLWRPRFYFAGAVGFSLLMTWVLLIAVCLRLAFALLMDDLSPYEKRGPSFLLAGCGIIMLLGVHFEREKWRRLWRPVVSLFRSRIEANGKMVPWEVVDSCHWSRYSPGTLIIQTANRGGYGRDSVPVPERHRAVVEQMLRDRGKWREQTAGT